MKVYSYTGHNIKLHETYSLKIVISIGDTRLRVVLSFLFEIFLFSPYHHALHVHVRRPLEYPNLVAYFSKSDSENSF